MPAGERIAIVGAGIIGCAIAFELSRRGAAVTVFDGRPLAAGATQASAGILAPYTEAHAGGALSELTNRGLACYDGFVGRVRATSSVRFEYSRSGTVEIADTPERVDELAARLTAPWAAAAGFEWLDADAVRTRMPSVRAGALGALRCGTHGYVAVPSFVAALADAAKRCGATFELGDAVTVIEPAAAVVRVSAGGHSRGFDRVVLCAGAWSSTIDPAGGLRTVRPIRGQLVRLRVPEVLFREVIWGSGCYIVPWQDGTVLVGATSEDVGFEERATAEGVRGLLSAAESLVPALGHGTFVEVRVGLRPATATGLPVLGPSPEPRVIYAAGHFRNGILLAPLTAQLIGDYVFDGASDPAFSAA